MKHSRLFASLLLGIFVLPVPIHAAQQQSDQGIEQKVSKTAYKAAAQAKVSYHGAPQFALITGTRITYATNSPQAVLHIGHAFYLLFTYFNPIVRGTQNVWLVSASANGSWIPAQSLPQVIPAVVCSQISAYPFDPYQLCALPWTSGVIDAM